MSRLLAACCGGLLVLAPTSAPSAEAPAWRAVGGDVRVVVPLKPGGAFDAKTEALSGTLLLGSGSAKPAQLSGELVLDLATIDTGIGLRNQHLREKYLQVARGPGFDRAVLSEIRVDAAAGPEFEGESGFSGSLLLHNVKRSITGSVELRRAATGIRVKARFSVTLTDFGIEPPIYLGVGVANRVMVHVLFQATPVAGAAR